MSLPDQDRHIQQIVQSTLPSTEIQSNILFYFIYGGNLSHLCHVIPTSEQKGGAKGETN